MAKSRLVAIRGVDLDNLNGISIHLPGCIQDYATLCGLAGEGDWAGGQLEPLPAGAKVNCEACKAIWEKCREFRKNQFENK